MPTLEGQSTGQLLERARRGSQSAMNRLMASCRTALRRRAKARLPGSLARKQDVSDVVQDCQFQAFARFREFEGRSVREFHAWILTILDRLISHQRRFWGRKRRDQKREEPLALGGGTPCEPAGSTTSVLGRLSREQEREQLMVILGWCREEHRQVIDMRFLRGRSHEEIADALGIEPTAARKRSSRAVRSLDAALRFHGRMTERGLNSLRQDLLGLHHIGKATPGQIADRLQLPEEIVKSWLAMDQVLLREIAREET